MRSIFKKYVSLQSILLIICLLFSINVVSLTVSNRGCADSMGQMVYRGMIENGWSRIQAGLKLSSYLQSEGYTNADYKVKHSCVNIASIKKDTTYTATVQFNSEPQNEYQYVIRSKSGQISQVVDIPFDEKAIDVSREREHSETGQLILEMVQYLTVHFHYQESDILSINVSKNNSIDSFAVIFKDEPYIQYNFQRKQAEPKGNLHYQDYLLIKKSVEYSEIKHQFPNE